MKFWSAHTHSKYSTRDAMADVPSIVERAAWLGYPALGLTDHGNMAGAVQLYTGCRKAGIKPLPGVEAYIAVNRHTKDRPNTMHMCLLATTEKGYRNLVGLTTQSHKQFRYKPILDFADLAQAAEDGRLDGIAATSGCWFGMLPTMLREGHPSATQNILGAMAGWFGSGLYIEIQRHNVKKPNQDDELHARLLYTLAQNMGLPVLIGQDSHYLHREEQPIHDTMKKLVSWSDDPEDAVFPGDAYWLCDESWMREHHDPDVFQAGLEGLTDLYDKAKVRIPELDKFQLKVPDVVWHGDTDGALYDIAVETIKDKVKEGGIPAKQIDDYFNRMDEEFEVVKAAGFAGYLLFTAKVTEEMTRRGIMYNVRGSASGSLLCWLLDITSLDPIRWNLIFDRFLSKDRTKPPDIDVDVEHLRRDEILDWLRQTYHVVQISTWLKMGLTDEDGDTKGSLLVKYRQYQRKSGEDHTAPIAPDVMKTLRELSAKEPFMGYGVHAAGLVIAPDEETMEAVPLQYVASSKTMVTAYDKDDVERMGLLKLDVLGLKTLTALKTMETISGVSIKDIPLNDRKVYNTIGRGETVGMFQLEGYSAMNGCKRLKPTRIHDIIAAMALFRPATMESGATDEYIRRRKGDENVPVRHEIIMRETKDTYGVLLYQEQAINVLRALGLESEEIEKARKAIKASNAAVGGAREEMQRILTRVRTLAKGHNMSFDDLAWLEKALDAYAGYGFNRAHATAYGLVAYATGWYAVNQPLAFWAAMLDAYTGAKQELTYLAAAREAGNNAKPKFKVRAPHVNRSRVGYNADLTMNTIRKGLTSIKGIGDKAAEELAKHAPYKSLTDLARKVSAKRVTGAKALGTGHSPAACGGVITALYEAGALEGLEHESIINTGKK